MRQQRGGVGAGRREDDPVLLTRAVNRAFRFVRLAEFEIFFVLFFLIAFFLFKDLIIICRREERCTVGEGDACTCDLKITVRPIWERCHSLNTISYLSRSLI
ncbi:uncharacterized protein LOC100277175 [Zea mays]|uniref:uncharacterized protein LOC100277175 n=1 Tax=Zea mays TaxID=4577 RepID=UPI000182B268|nr:uncharacterized protein LOC100277175 [Zea mays]|eukprot:NP_001333217.1 uncharacterized LOC100277175 [Zea mays]